MNRLKDLRKAKGYTQTKMQMLKRIPLALDTRMDYLAELTDSPIPYPRKQ